MRSDLSGLDIRPAEARDAAFLADLRNLLAAFFMEPGPATTERTLEMLASSHTYVLEHGGETVGSFAIYTVEADEGEFGRLMIQPQFWGNGLGRRIMAMAFGKARDLGLRRLRLEVRTDNVRATRVYHLAGFQCTGVMPSVTRMEAEVP